MKTPQKYLDLMEHAQRILRERSDPRPWIEANLFIRSKDRRIIPFRFNPAQIDYYRHRTRFDLIAKPRQLGFTTQICGLFLADTILRPNTTSVMVAHELESTARIFRIVQLFWERLPAEVKRIVGPPSRSNRREFLWPKINSHFFVGTAGALTFGRGMTIHNLHCSEFAFWPRPQEALIALTEAVDKKGGRIVIESTPNGVGNFFHDLWTEALEGRGRYAAQFYVWWEDPTYSLPGPALTDLSEEEMKLRRNWHLSDDQIRWRRAQQLDLRDRFPQEYPEDPVSCFLASGRCIFNARVLTSLQQRITAQPPATSVTSLSGQDGSAIPLAPAKLLVWKFPESGESFVIGADIGEGLPGGDASCAVVLNRETGEQVGDLHGRVSPERFAHLLAGLGRYFRGAEVAVERNNHGHSTLNTLRNQLRYPHLYYHVAYDSRAGSPREVQLGWPTTSATKPILVDDLTEAINTGALRVNSALLVQECRTFILTDSGAAEAQPGKYDDRVMAAGIAWQVRKRPRARATTERPPGW